MSVAIAVPASAAGQVPGIPTESEPFVVNMCAKAGSLSFPSLPYLPIPCNSEKHSKMAHREFVIGLNNKKGDGEGFFPVESFVRSQRMRPEQVSLLRPKAKVHCPSFVLGWGSARLCRVSS